MKAAESVMDHMTAIYVCACSVLHGDVLGTSA